MHISTYKVQQGQSVLLQFIAEAAQSWTDCFVDTLVGRSVGQKQQQQRRWQRRHCRDYYTVSWEWKEEEGNEESSITCVISGNDTASTIIRSKRGGKVNPPCNQLSYPFGFCTKTKICHSSILSSRRLYKSILAFHVYLPLCMRENRERESLWCSAVCIQLN